MDKSEITPGRYRHFKGNEYEVIGTATHSETLEKQVVFRALYGEKKLWIRPRGNVVRKSESRRQKSAEIRIHIAGMRKIARRRLADGAICIFDIGLLIFAKSFKKFAQIIFF